MKKLLCILIALAFVFTTFASVSFAEGRGKYKDLDYDRLEDLDDLDYFDNWEDAEEYLKGLMQQFKEFRKDWQKRKQLLKQISKLKKKYKKFDLSVYIDGEEIELDVPPVFKNGNVIKTDNILVPIGPLAKALGAKVTYDPKDDTVNPIQATVTIEKDGKVVKILLTSGKILVDGKEVDLGDKAQSIKGRTMVPISFILKIFKNKVEVDEDTGSIIIDKDNVVIVNDNATDSNFDENNKFNYSDSDWEYKSNQTGAYQNDVHWTDEIGASFRIKFNGTKIKLYGVKASTYGLADVYIDGSSTPAAQINCYSYRTKNNTLLYTSPSLTTGEHTLLVVVKGADRGDNFAIDRAEITECGVDDNLALRGTAVASSVYDDGSKTYLAQYAVDGKADTRWSSDFADDEWIYVNLGATKTIKKVVLKWEEAYAEEYKIQVSNDETNWRNITYNTERTNESADLIVDEITFASYENAKYVKMSGVDRATEWGYSLWEFEVYGPEQNIGGSLSGTEADAAGNVNLSSGTPVDWIHWAGDNASSINRKAGVSTPSKINNFTRLGSSSASMLNYNEGSVKFSWTDGDPTDTDSNVEDMLSINGEGNGYFFTVPAGTTQRTLKVYVGALGAKGKLEVSLGDKSAPDYVGYVETTGIKYKVFTINYKAATSGQILIVKYTVDSQEPGAIKNIMLQAASYK